MTTDIPTTEPARIQAGDTVQWTKALADYPADDGWTLTYRIINQYDNYTVPTSASGAIHAVTITAVTTAAYQPGEYKLIGWVTKGSERFSIPQKALTIKPDLAVLEHYDERTPAKIALDAMNEGLQKYARNAWKQSYTIEGRTMTFRSVSDFFAMRTRLEAEVKREEQARRLAEGLGANTNRIRVRLHI